MHQTIPSNNWWFIWCFRGVLWGFGEIGWAVAYLETTVSELEQLGELNDTNNTETD